MSNSFDLEEISRHNTPDDVWIAVDGKVYDLTEFKNHPGGPEIILDFAGKDGTKEFEEAEHTQTDLKELK